VGVQNNDPPGEIKINLLFKKFKEKTMKNDRHIYQSTVFLCLALLLISCGQQMATVSPEQLDADLVFKEYPLSTNGPYQVGYKIYSFEDPNRGNREVNIHVYYPAQLQRDEKPGVLLKEGKPDLSGAPYPLILSSSKVARIISAYLVSRGFTWVSVDDIDSYMAMNSQMIHQPLDILFALEQAGAGKLEGLEGVIDVENAGAIGYSFDGYNALAMSGARVDPEFYLSLCEAPTASFKKVSLSAFSCQPSRNWEKFAANAPTAITTSEDGLWQPMTDERIKAVIPMAGEGWWLFGERGLAAVDRPILIMAGMNDELYEENVLIYQDLGTPDKTFISISNRDHMLIYDKEAVSELA